MNKELKNALKESFDIPLPTRKKEFFRNVPKPSISNLEFIVTQAAYIRKWAWGAFCPDFYNCFHWRRMFETRYALVYFCFYAASGLICHYRKRTFRELWNG